ncbi:MAG: Glu-tRNA(Gln) amidotransferase subunit GatE, partial [Hadesarchaea archaeon]|nr:Glu-tRNA(Gln) amidotransferase subunit GatE [Hadesarchaea archaeon]
ENHRFGTELADYAKVYSNVKGIFHTDELPGNGISKEEVKNLRKELKANDQDAVVLVAGNKEDTEKALKTVIDRANKALKGIPEETRRARPDGKTQFMRPLPGAARMYVETDIPPLVFSESKLNEIKDSLPDLPEEREGKYMEEFDLNEELAQRMSVSENASLFERLVNEYEVEPTLVATTLEETLTHLEKEGLNTKKLGEGELGEILSLISSGTVSKSALDSLLEKVSQGFSPEEAIEELGLEKMSRKELEELISEIISKKSDLIKERGDHAIDPLMGLVMKKVRGKADGELVHEILEEKLRKYKT